MVSDITVFEKSRYRIGGMDMFPVHDMIEYSPGFSYFKQVVLY